MNSIVQGVIGALVAAAIIGIVTYAFIVNENKLLISTLGEKVTELKDDLGKEKKRTSGMLQKNADAISEIKLLIARTFPSREFISMNSSGAQVINEIPPLESAVIVSAANVVKEIKNVGTSENHEDAKKDLERATLEYEKLLSIAKEENPNIEVELKAFSEATPVSAQQDAQLVKAHQEIGEINQAVMVTTGISIEDIKKHGIAGGKNSEVRKAGRAIGKVFGW